MTELPASFYSIIGILLVMNFATLGSLIVFIFKVGKFVSDTEHGVKDAKDASIRAHKRIDKIRGESMKLTKNKMVALAILAVLLVGVVFKLMGFSEAAIMQAWGLLGTVFAIMGYHSAKKEVQTKDNT